MPIYEFTARSVQGKVKKGKIEGKDERAVADSLRAEGFFATKIEKEKGLKENLVRGKLKMFSRISLKEKMMFARHLGVMLSSGLSIPRAIDVISNQTKSRNFKTVLFQVEENIKTGKTLADSLEYSGVFDDLSVNMIRVGEVGGNLEEVLNLLADQLEKEHNLISKVRGAMYYPSVIMFVMIVIGVMMMTYVVPQLTSVFSDVQATLPFTTKLIIDSSNFMAENKLLVFGLFATLIICLVLFFRSKPGKKVAALLFLKTPIIKNITMEVNNARFARIFASLIRSGVPVVESLKIISETLTNQYYQQAFRQVMTGVQKGKTLHEELNLFPKLFPTLVVQMVEVGEETGKTADVLSDLARFYEEEIDRVTKNLSSIIEPVLMVIIGTAVGFFAISMIMPMYSVMENI